LKAALSNLQLSVSDTESLAGAGMSHVEDHIEHSSKQHQPSLKSEGFGPLKLAWRLIIQLEQQKLGSYCNIV
jgi:hypothetical protein